jgi:hypothetical protein
MSEYLKFLFSKSQLDGKFGFSPKFLPSFLFDFQTSLVEWSVLKGRAAIFADCGLGKTPMQLVWAQNVVEHENKPVVILTPLAVSAQTVTEAEKFGIEAKRAGKDVSASILVTNYERLHYLDPNDFAGVVCDESSILKNFDGTRRSQITEFMRKVKYRLLCTATAAPNDYTELGTSSEAIGYLGHMDMLNSFFKNDQNTSKARVYLNRGTSFSKAREAAKWRFKGHAEESFWKWVCSWSRAIRKPSDLGFNDSEFILPPIIEREHLIDTKKLRDGMLFALPAVGLKEQREERRISIEERCEKVAELVNHSQQAISWCHLNPEGDLLTKLIRGAVQVSGDDSDEEKEEKFLGFASGQIRVLVTKPKIGAWGLNFQNCAHVTFFPSHSFEQYYQGIRRCWRFGQKQPVLVDVVTTEGERGVLENLQRKQQAADKMFENLVLRMGEQLHIEKNSAFKSKEELPSWLSTNKESRKNSRSTMATAAK